VFLRPKNVGATVSECQFTVLNMKHIRVVFGKALLSELTSLLWLVIVFASA